jgi:hypothetical protein
MSGTNIPLLDSERSAPVAASPTSAERILIEYSIQWMKIPGVVGVGTVRCINNHCDSDTIEITVQPAFMKSVRNQIPSSVNGVSSACNG